MPVKVPPQPRTDDRDGRFVFETLDVESGLSIYYAVDTRVLRELATDSSVANEEPAKIWQAFRRRIEQAASEDYDRCEAPIRFTFERPKLLTEDALL